MMYDTVFLYDDVPQKRGLQQIRVRAQAIVACEPTAYPMSNLKRVYNEEFTARGVDVSVTSCRQIRGAFSNHLVVDMSVAAESPIAPAVAALIILLIKILAVTVAAVVVIVATGALAEQIWGRPKFYASDGTEFDSLAGYITYQQAIHPGKYVCYYCGQVFNMAEERDTHEKECPWKGGVPDGEEWGWVKWVVGGFIVVGGILVVTKILPKILPERKRRMRII